MNNATKVTSHFASTLRIARAAQLGSLGVAAVMVWACGGSIGGTSSGGADASTSSSSSSSSSSSGSSSGSSGSSGASSSGSSGASSSGSSGASSSGSSGAVDGGGAAPACYDGSLAASLVFQDTMLDQGRCSLAQVQALYAACFSIGANQATCETFIGTRGAPNAANTACLNCAFPFYNPNLTPAQAQLLPSPAMLVAGQYVIPNVKACEYVAAGGAPSCGRAQTDLAYCAGETCGECDVADYEGCASHAVASDCSTRTPDASCDVALNANLAAAQAKCGSTNMTFETLFEPLVMAFCGAP